MKKPIRVAVTGPAGNIGYSLLFRIAAGDMFGPDQPVILQLLDRASPESQQKVTGVMMELDDCAFPLLAGLENSPEATTAFRDADVALLVGARPRSKGMERADLPMLRFLSLKAVRSTKPPRATARCSWSATPAIPMPGSP